MVVILLNTLVFAMYHHDMNSDWTLSLFIINIIFTVIYLIEAIIKIVGLRQYYFQSGWNWFDFIIVVLSVISVILDFLAQVRCYGYIVERIIFNTIGELTTKPSCGSFVSGHAYCACFAHNTSCTGNHDKL